MGVNIFAVSYEPARYVELIILDDNDVEYISSSGMQKSMLLGLVDAYDSTFFNKSQMNKLLDELSYILANGKSFEDNAIFKKLKRLKEAIQLASKAHDYLIFIGD
jgi:hypothetical protein